MAPVRTRRGYSYDDSENSSDSNSENSEDDETSALQIALRDKEEALVQSALARIRRAQEKGKREVKLNQDELDALEKRRKRLQSASMAKDGKNSGSASSSERRRRSDRQLVTLPIGEPKGRKRADSRRSRDVTPPVGAPPGMLISGNDGVTYAPLGYYPPQTSTNRNSPTRPRSSTSQQSRGAPPQFSHQQGSTSRHYSDGARPNSSSSNGSRRPLPDEEDWQPSNSRRDSQSSGPVDPFEYQVDAGQPPPIPQHYLQGQRVISAPVEVAYSTVRRTPPSGPAYPSMVRGSSDPTLRRKSSRRDGVESLEASSEEGVDYSDELGNGVQVLVEEHRPVEREKAAARKPVGGRKKGKGR